MVYDVVTQCYTVYVTRQLTSCLTTTWPWRVRRDGNDAATGPVPMHSLIKHDIGPDLQHMVDARPFQRVLRHLKARLIVDISIISCEYMTSSGGKRVTKMHQ